MRALAALDPDRRVFVCDADDGVPYGALRLLRPDLKPAKPLTPVAPLETPLAAYAARWREQLARHVPT